MITPPEAAPFAPGDFRKLQDLASRWNETLVRRGAAADLRAALAAIDKARRSGPDFLSANVRGNSIPELQDAALRQAADLWGPDADAVIEEIDTPDSGYSTSGGGRFHTRIRVRCLNYTEILK